MFGSPAMLMWSMVFGVIGFAYYRYGKKQGAAVPLIAGIVLFIFPYFISNVYWLVAVGAVIVLAPFLSGFDPICAYS